MRRPYPLILALPFAAACGSPVDVFEATFADELVEAPARTVDVAVVETADCDALLAVPHEDVATVSSVISRLSSTYPVDPEKNVLEGIPRGRGLAFDVAVYDQTPKQIARSCQVVILDPANDTKVTVPMAALPQCATEAVALDMTLVIDGSLAMSFADIELGSSFIDRTKAFVGTGFPAGSTLNIVLHGASDPSEIHAPSSDIASLQGTLEAQRDTFSGESRHYAAITYATGLARARALCGRRPAILMIAAGQDSGGDGALDNALIGIAATRGDTTDDIFTYGIGVSGDGIVSLQDLITDELGDIRGARTELSFAEALSTARQRIQGLIVN